MDDLEVILFGSGYGECLLLHCGSNQWIIIDSCISKDSKEPVALEYLASIGVDAAKGVVAVVVTHWHDDHIKGISKIAEKCSAATFFISAALMTAKNALKFQTMVLDSAVSRLANLNADSNSGVKEFKELLEIIRSRPRQQLDFALNDKLLVDKNDYSLWSLSPHNTIFEKAIEAIISQIPDVTGGVKRVRAPAPNYTSVVLWLKHKDTRLLLGADLEEASDHKGWSLIVEGKKPTIIDKKAELFKVAHHGSDTGHHPSIYTDLLIENPICLVAPFNRKPKLPGSEDIKRILSSTSHGYATASPLKATKPKKSTDRAIRTKLAERNAVMAYSSYSYVKARATASGWQIETFGDACHLTSLVDAA
jgi:hypothetical protein